MRISRDKVDICRARKKKSVADLAEAYGVSRARMNVILNQREVSVVSAGRLADALECDVTEILENSERRKYGSGNDARQGRGMR